MGNEFSVAFLFKQPHKRRCHLPAVPCLLSFYIMLQKRQGPANVRSAVAPENALQRGPDRGEGSRHTLPHGSACGFQRCASVIHEIGFQPVAKSVLCVKAGTKTLCSLFSDLHSHVSTLVGIRTVKLCRSMRFRQQLDRNYKNKLSLLKSSLSFPKRLFLRQV